MWNKIKILYNSTPGLIVLFMVFFPFIANFFVCNTEMLDNRPLYVKPAAFSTGFAKDYESYYNDTFAFRKKFVKRYLKLQGRLKFDSNTGVFGLDDWVFYNSAKALNNDTMGDYKGEARFTQEELDQIVSGVQKAANFFAKYGASKYVVFMAPNKSNVYPEFMPLNMQKARVSAVSRNDAAMDYLKDNTKISVINSKSVLLKNKPEYQEPLYYKRDTHWNNIGAYLGYVEILKALKLKTLPLDDYMIYEAGYFKPDMDASFKDIHYKIKYLEGVKFVKVKDEKEPLDLQVYNSKQPIYNKKVLVIRDSFAGMFEVYFARAFKETVYVFRNSKAHRAMKELMEEYKPDYVVDEVVERNIIEYTRYNDYY